jgi:KRAB domain-containing zinc finger protein
MAFSQQSDLNKHVNTAHKKNLTRYSCDLCDYSSCNRCNLEKHSKAVHLGPLGRKSSSVTIVTRLSHRKAISNVLCHVNTVNKKLTRYSCDLCDYSSYHRSDLEAHSKAVHLGKKDFKCDICDKSFSWKSSITGHINRIHKNLKNYTCELCNYTSYSNYDLKKHLIVQHVDKNVESTNLQRHILFKEAQKDQMFVSVEKFTM